MTQGWNIDPTADTITFFEAPPTGVSNIVVTEFAAGAVGGTDVFAVGAWSYRYGYPAEIEFYADRLWFARTPGDPQTVWASEIGNYVNFGRSSPIVDSDAVSFTINARQVNAVQDLVPLDNLLVLTTGQEWKTTGGQDDVITPSTIGMKPQSKYGTSDVPACVIGESAIFIQKQGSKIRDLGYKFEKDGFRGTEISVWADHLVEGYTFSRIDYMSAPWPVLWFVRDDGNVVGCTYMPEQEITGWHPHDTDGSILDACCLPGDSETETYMLVQRTIDGEIVQYIEQLAPTRYDDRVDYFYLDSGLTYDGRNASATTVTLTTGAGWTGDDILTLTASSALFIGSTDVGDGFTIRSGDESVRVVITDYLSTTAVEVRSIGDVPASLRSVAIVDWMFQRDSISGLWHLEGKEVVILSDGNVHPVRTVTNGAVPLQTPGGVVHVGRTYRGHVETLELNAPGGESMRQQRKLLFKVSILVKDTRGILAGTSLDPDYLYPIATRQFENYTDPTEAYTGALELNLSAEWGRDAGHVHIISDDPLPMEILSITPRAVSSD